MANSIKLSLCVMIYTFTLCITVEAVKSTNTTKELSWTEISTARSELPLAAGRRGTLKTIFAGDNNHRLALLRWSNVTELHPSLVNLTMRSHTFDGRVHEKICDIAVPPENETEMLFPAAVTFLKSDRILLTWKEKHKTEGYRLKLQVISMDACKSSEFIHINGPQSELDRSEFLSYRIDDYLVKLENNVEIILTYPLTCIAELDLKRPCKIVFNYDGAQLANSPELFTVNDWPKNKYISEVHVMNYNGSEGIVFIASSISSSSTGLLAYSPIVGWIQLDEVFSKFFYSNSGGYASLCWGAQFHEIRCKWLDGMHESNDTSTVKLHSDYSESWMDHSTINSPNGRVVIVYLQINERGYFLVADEIQKNGQCKRVAKVLVPEKPKMAKLSVDRRNQYCFSYITEKLLTQDPYIYEDTFASQCTHVLDEATLELKTCGEND